MAQKASNNYLYLDELCVTFQNVFLPFLKEGMKLLVFWKPFF